MMAPKVTIVTCYRGGTEAILSTWLASIFRHTKNEAMLDVVVLVKSGDEEDVGLKELSVAFPIKVVPVDVGNDPVSLSRIHGKMLDAYVPSQINNDGFVLTMDSDAFPIADGWLIGLVGCIEKGCKVAGILHPWAPPPSDMKKSKIEWRVRSQHCWENTHVACQLMRTADLVELGVKFSGGDDTGLLIPKMARERKWEIAGYKPTRCPKPEEGKIDPEYNRYVGLVYGDKVFHLGGYTRTTLGDEPIFDKEFGWVRERVLVEKGAEFLLDDALSYKFKFDIEEKVAAEKMQRLFGMRDKRMGE